MDLNEARKNLEACLSEDLQKQYIAILRQWFTFKSPSTKVEFDAEVRKILVNAEQIHGHNCFMLALISKRPSNRLKNARNTCDKGVFECADILDYVQPSSPTMLPPLEYENRSAASELFMPDSVFVSTRIAITTWEHGLDGAEDSVTELMVQACQSFVKNIVTAMIVKKKGYKIRDGKLQYGFNFPIGDPFIRNFHNIIDDTQESKVEVVDREDTFIPKSRPSLEVAEQRAAFEYSCAKRKRGDNILTVRLLYDTLKDNPHILGSHELQSMNLLKLSLQLDDDNLM